MNGTSKQTPQTPKILQRQDRAPGFEIPGSANAMVIIVNLDKIFLNHRYIAESPYEPLHMMGYTGSKEIENSFTKMKSILTAVTWYELMIWI